MLPSLIAKWIADAPKLLHLSDDANEEMWGRQCGYPLVVVDADAIDEDSFVDLYDTYADVFDELDDALFDEEGWASERFTLVAVLGVFDDPDEEDLSDGFPYLAQLDGLLLWDDEMSAFALLGTDVDTSRSLEENLVLVARNVDALRDELEA